MWLLVVALAALCLGGGEGCGRALCEAGPTSQHSWHHDTTFLGSADQ